MVVNYVDEWERAQNAPKNTLASKEMFAGIGGRGGLNAKESRRHGGSRPLIRDMTKTSNMVHEWMKNLGAFEKTWATAVTYWAYNESLDIAFTKLHEDHPDWTQESFDKSFIAGYAYIIGAFDNR